MIYTPYSPQASIAPYIEAIFHYEQFVPDHSIERLVPTGHVFILFELDDIERHTFDNDTLVPNASYSKAFVSGMHRNYISISAHENSEMLAVQFKPFGSYPFLHEKTDLINELVVPAHEIVGDELYQLRQEMINSASTDEKFQLVDNWLQKRFDEEKTPPEDIVQFVSQLQAEPVEGLNELIEAYPASQKKLIEEFKKYVGLTPKYYQRILRFNDLLKRLQNKDEVSWTEIAHDCGYFDQSHFIKEFKHFSGFNPRQFILNDYNKEDTNFFPIGTL
ncbi:MAG: helix-turn-helix domain-containing protein [Gammaproteobacteria bacterium]